MELNCNISSPAVNTVVSIIKLNYSNIDLMLFD